MAQSLVKKKKHKKKKIIITCIILFFLISSLISSALFVFYIYKQSIYINQSVAALTNSLISSIDTTNNKVILDSSDSSTTVTQVNEADLLVQVAKEQLERFQSTGEHGGYYYWAWATDNVPGWSGTGWAWCANFVTYCVVEAGLGGFGEEYEGYTFGNLSKNGSVMACGDEGTYWYKYMMDLGFEHYYPAGGDNYTPQPGDIILWKNQHIGIVIGMDEEGCCAITIEGNTSPGSGSCNTSVASKTRNIKTCAINGKLPTFFHPNYKTTTVTTDSTGTGDGTYTVDDSVWSDVVYYMYRRFIDAGYTPEAACAVLGSSWYESGGWYPAIVNLPKDSSILPINYTISPYIPYDTNKHGSGDDYKRALDFGLFQLNGRSYYGDGKTRLAPYLDYIEDTGKDPYSTVTQMDFTLEVALNSNADSKYDNYQTGEQYLLYAFKVYGTPYDDFKKLTDIESAYVIWMKAFMGSKTAYAGTSARTESLAVANALYSWFVKGETPSKVGSYTNVPSLSEVKARVEVSTSSSSGTTYILQEKEPTTGYSQSTGVSYTCYNNIPWTDGTNQYTLYQKWLSAGSTFTNHIASYDGKYLVALAPTFGKMFDYVTIYLKNGEQIEAIIADIKNTGDPNYCSYGHFDEQNRILVLEMEVDYNWVSSGHSSILGSDWMPQWGSIVTKIVNHGTYTGLAS